MLGEKKILTQFHQQGDKLTPFAPYLVVLSSLG
jgi:hypothetical protein